MCAPIAALGFTGFQTAMAGLSALSAVLGTVGAAKSAQAQANLIAENSRNAAEENHARASAEMGRNVAAARASASRRMVAAGEAGVAGNSVGAEIASIFGQANQANALVGLQRSFQDRANATLVRVESSKLRQPHFIDSALRIGTAGMSGAMDAASIEKQVAAARAGRK